jgi:hypothetical protein
MLQLVLLEFCIAGWKGFHSVLLRHQPCLLTKLWYVASRMLMQRIGTGKINAAF